MNESKIYKVLVFILRPIFKFLYRLEVKGAENFPKSGKAIICPNHTSNADPILLAITTKRQVFFMAKKELFRYKILSKFFKSIGAFPVDRGKGDTSALDNAKSILHNENFLGIFIEGTRSKTGEFLRPKTGAAMIACETSAPIIPVCIRSADGGKIKIFKKNIVSIGKPLSTAELSLEQASGKAFRDASRMVMDKMKTLL